MLKLTVACAFSPPNSAVLLGPPSTRPPTLGRIRDRASPPLDAAGKRGLKKQPSAYRKTARWGV